MAEKYRICFRPQNREIEADAGMTILEAERMSGLEPDAPCGGCGKCGKCRVDILKGKRTGVVLACQTRIDSSMTVDTMYQEKVRKILSEGLTREVPVEPGAFPGEDQAEAKAAGREESGVPFFLMAFDIGTTTVVGYLLDGHTGRTLSVASRMNPQHAFGADVISRANYVLEHGEEGSRELRTCIVKAMNDLIREAAESAGVQVEDVLQTAVVGNTCMHHLFLGISPDSLVHAPYVPAVRKGMILTAEETGLKFGPRCPMGEKTGEIPVFELEKEVLANKDSGKRFLISRDMRRADSIHEKQGVVLLLPNIAGFVGADTIGCMVSAAFDRLEELTLMVDIGTNGEMVLGDQKKMLTTSTAAGPAFEGAKIECGMRGADGAVSHLRESDDGFSLEVVGDVKPVGICGSGLIDALAFLIRHGFISNYGAFRDPEDLEDPLACRLKNRLITVHGQPAFLLVRGEDSADGNEIYLTQKDVREVQLAKGAIAAGIQILTEKLGKKTGEIRHVFLAGAFGNYMDSGSACEIGMIPYELHDRITAVGNAAGEGAKLAAVNRGEFEYACRLSEETEFIELASESSFQDVFVDKLEFERAIEDE